MKRRNFIRTTGVAAAGTGLAGSITAGNFLGSTKNKLPRWKGFNLLDYFSPFKGVPNYVTTDDDLKWMADWGFDFVRLPMAYPRYVKHTPFKNITPDNVLNFDENELDKIQQLVERANKYGLHMSLNLHRAPGFCVNAGFYEPYNLWQDEEAQDAFYQHWSMWAKRFSHLSPKQISFDLVNEPCTREDMNDQFSQRGSIPGELYRAVAKKAMETIRKHNPDHLVIADGNNVGADVIPEIFDLNIGQSCRGYFPHYVSHYRASWVWKNPEDAPKPVWPGEIDGQHFSRKNLEEFYAPWIDAVKKGVGVHCGECGCYRETPHEVFLAWFGDVLDVLTQYGIGYALWNFRGDFGIMDSGRKDVEYEDWHGHKLDRKLLQLLQKYK
ncbi:Aryl-phospho-beta-D-glucosidase BglC, GH1 family [Mariniphaga anaerophila]|uniref:Aryl-phospho-beta-D-glucosidase BglC, GH1 family n=1 Tax=Mariniphaga anaerophila TaxID=1484053 RepID=A0A1M5GC56_9BACT|nr:cellulase family glycosylhydrolase [Mariniphaga anaerophila]SHG01323.1 Aryl-phospho-beta-D-glucosidase BglC, GH1 family [Mariniphaga anaerophila]